MESFDFDNVKAEKAAATRSYNRRIKMNNFLFYLEVVMALASLSWSSTYIPVVAEIANGFLHQSVVVFGKSLFVFVFVNVLVLMITVLSRPKRTESDLYDEYVSATETGKNVSDAVNSSEQKDVVRETETVNVGNAVNSPAEKEAVPTVTTDQDRESEPKDGVSPVRNTTVCAPATDSKKYNRTQSERIDREVRRELRRSETLIKRATARRSDAMEDLSNEEFRRTIESFIASKKKTLIQENTIDFKLQRKECMAIALSACN